MNPRPLTLALPAIDLHWAVEPRFAFQALDQLRGINWAQHVAEFQARVQSEDAEEGEAYTVAGGVALIPLSGPMTKRPQSFGGGASTVQMRRLVRAAAADPDVTSIALVIDSPGGQVSGTNELAADVAKARAQKQVVAYIEDLGASAAYWVAAQADAVFANETAFIGSIGTYLAVQDLSGLADKAGVKVHVLSTGAYKGAGYPGTAITEPQLAHWQHEVNQINESFLAAVATGRGLSLDYTRALADGRTHIAREAESIGLVDGVRTLESLVSDLQRGTRFARRHVAP